jgi:hypothetical protein
MAKHVHSLMRCLSTPSNTAGRMADTINFLIVFWFDNFLHGDGRSSSP